MNPGSYTATPFGMHAEIHCSTPLLPVQPDLYSDVLPTSYAGRRGDTSSPGPRARYGHIPVSAPEAHRLDQVHYMPRLRTTKRLLNYCSRNIRRAAKSNGWVGNVLCLSKITGIKGIDSQWGWATGFVVRCL